jgi:hypothetical protein
MATDQLLTNWQAKLKRMKLESIKEKSPGFFQLSGGFDMKVNPYNDTTTNGLTKAVLDWLKFSGCYANRISIQGTARIEKVPLANGRVLEKVRYTPSMSNKGTADIDAIVNGRPVKIEIKCKETKDRQRDDQKKEQARIEKAGGTYLVVGTMVQFLEWFYEFTRVRVEENDENKNHK